MCYKKDRWAIDTISEVEAKKLLKIKNPGPLLVHFQDEEGTEPKWMNKVSSLMVPIDVNHAELLNNFFNCEFTPRDFTLLSYDEYHKWQRTPEWLLWHRVTDIWYERLKALASERGLH